MPQQRRHIYAPNGTSSSQWDSQAPKHAHMNTWSRWDRRLCAVCHVALPSDLALFLPRSHRSAQHHGWSPPKIMNVSEDQVLLFCTPRPRCSFFVFTACKLRDAASHTDPLELIMFHLLWNLRTLRFVSPWSRGTSRASRREEEIKKAVALISGQKPPQREPAWIWYVSKYRNCNRKRSSSGLAMSSSLLLPSDMTSF